MSINEMKTKLENMIVANEDLSLILFEFKKYILMAMERDIPHINISTRTQVANYIIEYVEEGIKNGYFTANNISNVMLKLIEACQGFYEITSGLNFGKTALGCDIGLFFKNSFFVKNMKEIIFHELTHNVAPLQNQNLGILKLEPNKPTGKSIAGFNLINKPKDYEPIISEYMLIFLREIIAEATACDLANAYKSTKEEVCYGITSDWVAIYNRSYQQVGYEFLKTLSSNNETDERKLFKELTIKAINDENIGSQIIEIYKTKNPVSWKEDLHKITTVLGEIAVEHKLAANIEKVSEVRELMKKYMPKEQVISNVATEIRQEGFRVTSRHKR